MTIKRSSKTVEGRKVEGFEISCCTCPLTSFLVAVKHLPPEVVTKKFQERRWEVDRHGKDVCPKCIEKRHLKAAKPRRAHGEIRITPVIEHLPITSSNIQKVIQDAGIHGVQVLELEGKHPKFKIALPHVGELNIGRLHHAESRLVEVFDADFETNYLKPELTHVNGGATVHVTAVFNWIVGLRPKFHEPVAQAAELFCPIRVDNRALTG